MATPRARDPSAIDWDALARDPDFLALHAQKRRFLWRLMAFAVGYYFLLPVGAAWFSEIYRFRVAGPINVGLLFALSQFVVAWGIAWLYARRAGRYDALAAALVSRAESAGA
jgi:uncharacterized membrane protein (DUF485 family)